MSIVINKCKSIGDGEYSHFTFPHGWADGPADAIGCIFTSKNNLLVKGSRVWLYSEQEATKALAEWEG